MPITPEYTANIAIAKDKTAIIVNINILASDSVRIFIEDIMNTPNTLNTNIITLTTVMTSSSALNLISPLFSFSITIVFFSKRNDGVPHIF